MRTITTLGALIMAASVSAAGQQLPTDGIPPAFAGAVRLIQPPEKPGAWVLQVVSRGGLDGRGTGDLAISSDGVLTLHRSADARAAPPDVVRSLHQVIQTTAPSQWTAGSRLGICSDCLTTLVVLTLRQPDGLLQTHTAFWDVTTQGSVGADVRRIHDLVRTLQRQ